MADWQPILKAISGHLSQEPLHLAPAAQFETNADSMENGLCPLTGFSFLSLQGKDAEKFLQGQLTCDMQQIGAAKSSLAGHCNVKGRLHGIFLVIYIKENHYCLAMPSVQLEHVQATLKKYAIFSKVVIQPLSVYALGLVGEQNKINLIAPELNTLSLFDQFMLNQTCFIKLPCHDQNLSRFFVILDVDQATPESIINHWQSLTQLGFQGMNTTTWHRFNILSLLPFIYPETTELCLPHTLMLPQLGAVSFKKGCYTGQEIVARMQYLGNLKKTISCREFTCDTGMPILGKSLDPTHADHLLLDFVPLTSANSHEYLGLFVSDL